MNKVNELWNCILYLPFHQIIYVHSDICKNIKSGSGLWFPGKTGRRDGNIADQSQHKIRFDRRFLQTLTKNGLYLGCRFDALGWNLQWLEVGTIVIFYLNSPTGIKRGPMSNIRNAEHSYFDYRLNHLHILLRGPYDRWTCGPLAARRGYPRCIG